MGGYRLFHFQDSEGNGLCAPAVDLAAGRLLILDEEALYSLTLHYFAPRLQELESSQSVEIGGYLHPLLTVGTLQSFFHNPFATKVCPRCLAEGEAYGRLY